MAGDVLDRIGKSHPIHRIDELLPWNWLPAPEKLACLRHCLTIAPYAKRHDSKGATLDYFEEAKDIWTRFVPKTGQAQTKQGELLRAVEKLRDEATRNGNGNWDRGFEILLEFLETHLTDTNVFSIDIANQTRKILTRLGDYENPLLEDEPFDELGDRVVEYYRHRGSQPHSPNPELLR